MWRRKLRLHQILRGGAFFFILLSLCTTTVYYYLSDSSRFQTAEGMLSLSSHWADCVHWKIQVLIKFYKLTSVFFFLSFLSDNTDADNAAHHAQTQSIVSDQDGEWRSVH